MEHDLFSQEFFASPHAAFRRLRATDPVHWHPGLGMFLATRYEDVVTVMRSEAFSAERPPRVGLRVSAELAEKVAVYDRFLGHWMNLADPPRHTRLRALAGNAFSPQRVEALRPFVQELVDARLSLAREKGRLEVIGELAFPVPIAVICRMLGIPDEDMGAFKGWTEAVMRQIGAAELTPEVVESGHRGVTELDAYFRRLAAQRRKAPGDDLLSALVRADEAGNVLDDEELSSTAALLLVAGHETTTHLIGNAVLALLRNPEQLQRLREQPALIGSAVEEVLRYESPVFLVLRRAREDMELGGTKIRADQIVAPVFAAANRDPERFPDPDRMDIGRTDNRHLGLGVGLHYCLGAPLARLEAQITLQALVERLPGLALTEEPLSWVPSLLMHGLAALPVTFSG